MTYGIDTTIPARIYKFVDISYIDDPILKPVHTAGESYAQTIPGITALNFSNEFPAFTNHTFLYVIRDFGGGSESSILYNITDPLHPNYAGGQFPGANDGATVGLESIYHDTYGSIAIQLSNSYDGFIDIIFLYYTASQDRFFTDTQLSTTIDNDYDQYVNDTHWRGLETVVIDDKPYMLALSGSNAGEMHIIDLSSPQYPQWDSIVVNGTNNFTMLGNPSDVKIKTIRTDTFAFVASASDGGIQIINITNSTNPIAAGTLGPNILGFPNISGITDLELVDIGYSTYVVATSLVNDTLVIIDITNPEWPYLVASITDDQNNYTTLNDPTDIKIVRIGPDVYAMITSKTDYGFQIVSLTNNPDLLPPLLLNLSVHSDNMNNSLATVNDRITINLTTDDNLSLNYATIFDRIANVTIYDNILSATMDILQNDSGHVRFNMSVSDEAGNNLTVTDDDLVHSNVFVDTHEPLVLSLDLSSNYQNPSYAISGNKLTLTFKTNERIYDATALHSYHHQTPQKINLTAYTSGPILTILMSVGSFRVV